MEILVLTILVGIYIRSIHFYVGSPMANEYTNGRIFSIWGRFVTSQYSKFHNKETDRIYDKYPDDPESHRRPNPWNALGCCFICFGTWLSLITWLVLVPVLGLNPIFTPFLITGSVMVANRIDFV